MKKLFSLVSVLLIAIATMAANPIKVAGVEMNGSAEEMAALLHAKGFTLVNIEDGIIMLQGTYAKYDSCQVAIVGAVDAPIIYKTAVIFPQHNEWPALYENYKAVKKLMTAQLGAPTNDYEQWDAAIYPEDDTYRMYEVILGQCKFGTNWEFDEGKVEVIISGGWGGRCVLLNFYNKF